jgi:hypothetical protein
MKSNVSKNDELVNLSKDNADSDVSCAAMAVSPVQNLKEEKKQVDELTSVMPAAPVIKCINHQVSARKRWK